MTRRNSVIVAEAWPTSGESSLISRESPRPTEAAVRFGDAHQTEYTPRRTGLQEIHLTMGDPPPRRASIERPASPPLISASVDGRTAVGPPTQLGSRPRPLRASIERT